MNTQEILIVIVCSFIAFILICSCYKYYVNRNNDFKKRAMKLKRRRISPTIVELEYDKIETRFAEQYNNV